MGKLKLGDSGKRVTHLQKKLHEIGYDPGEVDGKFGYKTLESVSSLRKDLHLPPTGQVNRQMYTYLKQRQYFGSSYRRISNNVLKRTFTPRIGVFGFLPSADFEITQLDNDRSSNKVLKLEKTPFLITKLIKIRKYPFYLAFHGLNREKEAQILTFGKKAAGFIYLPWQAAPDLNKPLIHSHIDQEISKLVSRFHWKDLYLGIPLMAFEWIMEPREEKLALRHSDSDLTGSERGSVKSGYPKEISYTEAIGFLRKHGKKGRFMQGDLHFQYRHRRQSYIVKVISASEIQRLLELCDRHRLSGIIFWGATPGEDRLPHLNRQG